MKKFLSTLIFFCAIILTTTVNAENLVSLGVDDLGDEYFLDTESVALYKQEGKRIKFYTTFRTVYSDKGREHFANEKLASTVSTYAFANNNGQKLAAELSIKVYALDGSLIEEVQKNSPRWEKINPNSVFESVYDAAYRRLKL